MSNFKRNRGNNRWQGRGGTARLAAPTTPSASSASECDSPSGARKCAACGRRGDRNGSPLPQGAETHDHCRSCAECGHYYGRFGDPLPRGAKVHDRCRRCLECGERLASGSGPGGLLPGAAVHDFCLLRKELGPHIQDVIRRQHQGCLECGGYYGRFGEPLPRGESVHGRCRRCSVCGECADEAGWLPLGATAHEGCRRATREGRAT